MPEIIRGKGKPTLNPALRERRRHRRLHRRTRGGAKAPTALAGDGDDTTIAAGEAQERPNPHEMAAEDHHRAIAVLSSEDQKLTRPWNWSREHC